MKYGYARVSTYDQDLSLQLDALRKASCDHIFMEKMSGTTSDRPELTKLLSVLKAEDTLIIWKLDRLGRSTKDLIEISTSLKENNIELVSITENINTNTPMGRMFFTIMAGLAEFEADQISERTVAGLKAAKEQGRVGGRKPIMTAEKLEAAIKMIDEGQTLTTIAAQIGVSVSTLCRHLRNIDIASKPLSIFTPEKKAEAHKLFQDGFTYTQIARKLNIARATLYRHIPSGTYPKYKNEEVEA